MDTAIDVATRFARRLIKDLQPAVAAATLCIVGTSRVHAQATENVLYNFTGGTDGASPGYLRADTSGLGGAARALYGVAIDGGDQNPNCPAFGSDPSGCGTVFTLAAPKQGQDAWIETTLWNFTGGKDELYPDSALAASTNRIDNTTRLYGTTMGNPQGGSNDGTIFSLTGTTLKTISRVRGYQDYSADVRGPIAIDSSGAIYATAGEPAPKKDACGTVEKFTPPAKGRADWTKTTIWVFSSRHGDFRKIGCEPQGIRIDGFGALYGVLTESGNGKLPCYYGCGSIFKLTPPAQGRTAWSEQTIWTFGRGTDGSNPMQPPVIAKDGTLYGTTVENYSDCGTVYKLAPPRGNRTDWKEDVIWRFSGSDGCGPIDTPIIDKTGAVYGTTDLNDSGHIYKLTPPAKGQTAWTESNIFSFPGGKGGGFPVGSLVPDRTGILYGGAIGGGTDGKGLVFSLTGTGFVPE